MPTLAVDNYIVSEADGYVDIVVRLDVAAGSGQAFSVNYATSSSYGTATSGSDYTHTSGTLTFTTGVTEQTVRVFITQNATIEDFESFFFNLSNPTGGVTIGRTSTLISIVDDDSSVATPSLSVRDVVVDEKAGTATFAVVLGGHNGQSSNSEVTVNYATASGTATAGSDFAGESGVLSFAPGETVKNVVVQINNDALAEGAERFFLNLSSPSGATILKGQGVATIGASDGTAVSQPRITVQDTVVGEGDGYVDVVVSLSAPGQNVVSVNYSANLSYDTAAYSSDYTYVNGTLTFSQGETTKVVRIQLLDDVNTEGLEHFRFGLSSPSNATLAKTFGSVYIVDNDAVVETPSLHVRDVVVDEKAGTASFVVLLGGAKGQSSNSVVTVNYATANGTATAGSDYAATSGTLTFAPGETVKTVVVNVADDALAEGAERFFLNLSSPSGATILKGQGVATIGPSDATAVAQPRITVQDMVVGEGDGFVDMVVSLSAPGQNVVTVSYQNNISYDTAAYSSDYSYTSGTITFAPGETTQVVRIQLLDDVNTETLEHFRLGFSSPTNATIATTYGSVYIVDNDTVVETPNLFVRDVVVDEKAGTASFVVMLGGAKGQSSNSLVTVNYATANGTATAGTDYAATSGTLTFAPGETAKTVVVNIADDALVEGPEQFFLNLSNPSGATILKSQGVATIGASDATAVAQPRISIQEAIVGEGDGYVDVVVSLSSPGQNVVTVNYQNNVSYDTASYSSDYSYTSGTLTFAPGETTKVVRIQLIDDANTEGYESFGFSLSSPTNATIAQGSPFIGIVDNDNVVETPTLYVRDTIVDEKSGTASFVVMLGGPAGQSSNNVVTVAYSTSGGTATAGLDYATTAGMLVFAPGETAKTVVVPINDDSTAEGVDRINFVLSNPSGATIADGRAVAEIGRSDATVVAQPSISAADTIVSEGDGYVDVALTLSAPSAAPVSASFYTNNGTASYSSDYGYRYGSLTFAPGQTTAVVRILILDDSNSESLENFNLYLSSATGATIAKPTTSIGIIDNDTVGVNVFSYGRSDDIYTVVNSNDVVVENPGGGTDLVRSPVNFTLPVNVENLTLIGGASVNGTGNALANVIIGNGAANRLIGGAGNDTLNGGIGADTLIGGAGNDVLVVDNANDIVSEVAGGGIDRVESSRNYTLGDYVENLTLTGAVAINGTGNELNNVIIGNGAANVLNGLAGNDALSGGAGNDTLNGGAGNDTLDGGTGNDRMVGGTGNDTYIVDSTGDVIVEALSAGIDTVLVNRNFSLSIAANANLENLTLTGTGAFTGTGSGLNNVLVGNAANNLLSGLDGNDTLNGAAGADTMLGGKGNDVYYVDNAGDRVFETTSTSSAVDAGGSDKINSSVSFSLAASTGVSFVEHLTLTGASAINGTGNDLSNVITGNGAINTLTGGKGNDTLNGMGGADKLLGGLGNDTYVVDNLGDVVTEALNAGTDTVQSSISYTLGANVERLTLIGNTTINGTGNALNNILTGNGAANVLNGRAGADTMAGGAGNDIYVVDNVGDRVNEALNAGTDTVQSGISYTLGNNVERLTLTGTAAINGTGNTLNNLITGNGAANTLRGGVGNDTLNGGAGNDVLIGGAGADRLTGGAGNDIFHFDSKLGSDTITDFNSVADTFRFSQASIRIGDGDTVRDGFVVHNFYGGGFSTAAEVVVFTPNVFGAINAASAASVIGSAATNFNTGATRLFVVDNGTDSGIFLFRSSALNAQVSAAELTQIASFNGTTSVASDYVFSA